MRKLIIVAFLFLSPVILKAQANTLSFSLHPSSESLGYGLGGSYAPGSFGGFMIVASDLRGKHNSSRLETGVGADVAVNLPETQSIDSWISVTGGLMQEVHSNIWLMAGIGYTAYDTFSEHSGRYIVYRGRESAANFAAGAMITPHSLITGQLLINTAPFSIGAGIGFKLPTNGE